MSRSLRSFWSASLLLCLGLLLHCGEAQVHTEATIGPLYRCEGAPLFIFCNVSGFASSSTRKEFEIRIRQPSRPNLDINIISTMDSMFTYGMYLNRVSGKEITVTYVSPNAIVFEVQSLQKSDEGDFDCTVVNTGGPYLGTYSAMTTVKVIDNSLSISSPASASPSYNEGDTLTLTCQAYTNTIQHTHLSLAWYLHKDGEDKAQPIISLDRYFTLSPGLGFERRYQAGLIRLDKVGEATYKLKMAQLELSDQGRIYCQTEEWIQDPDRSWYSIAQKKAEETTLNVKAREVVPDTSSLVVQISAPSTTLQEGQELSLSCSVDTQNSEEKFFSVAWMRGSVELARIGPTGILSVGLEYAARAKGGELRAARVGVRDHHLILHPVQTEDQGEYICRAWPEDRGPDGGFTQGASQDSSSQQISILATESGLALEMQTSVDVNEGSTLQLTCKVHGIKDQLSVTWQRKGTPTSTAVFASVISLSQEGVTEKAEEFMSRKVKAARPAADTFTLELDEVTPSDSGVYLCVVSEWKINSKTNSQSQNATVTVAPANSFVKVNLISRNNMVTVGENVELMCRVRGITVPVTLIWSLQRDASTIDNILTLYSDGAISWSGDQDRYQLKVVKRKNEAIHYLLINGASHREAGRYQCSVSVFLENVHKKLPPSNQLAVNVMNPVSKLALTATPALMSNINTDIDIKCSVTTKSSESSRYAVTWNLQQHGDNKTIVSSDQDALVTFGSQVELSHRQRIGMKRTSGPGFELSIRQARISDGGLYTCEVVEWIQDPRGGWYELPPVSETTRITVTEPANDLRLDQKELSLIAREGDEVKFKCHIISGAPGPSFFYKVTWVYTHDNSSTMSSLVELDYAGLLSYPKNQGIRGLQGRLRLSRPSQSSFFLGIQRAHEGDSGIYKCQVELYQLDNEGHWQQKASESSGPIKLTVNVPERQLSIAQEEVKLNTSTTHGFMIPCQITKQSSNDSEFQVKWFWRKETETKERLIFTYYRNSTLRMFEKGDQLKFNHPLPNQFSLTFSKPSPEDSGVYFCEVEEWLPSLAHGWRKLAVKKSGYSAVNVYAEGNVKAVSEPGCNSNTWIGILVPIIFCALLVIFILVMKICRRKEGNKSQQSLWVEQHPLNTKPSAADS